MYIIYMIGDDDGYDDDDDDGDDVMIILPSPLLGKLCTFYVKDMHDFHLKGYMGSDIFVSTCHIGILSSLPYTLHTQYIVRTDPPFLRGLRFIPAGVDAQFGDPPAEDIYSTDWESSTIPEPSRFGT